MAGARPAPDAPAYYIFGAHSRAQTLAEYLRNLEPEMRFAAFLVDDEEENPGEWNGVPVLRLPEQVPPDRTLPVYLAIRGAAHAAVTERLRGLGFRKIIPVTPEMDMDL